MELAEASNPPMNLDERLHRVIKAVLTAVKKTVPHMQINVQNCSLSIMAKLHIQNSKNNERWYYFSSTLLL